MERRVGVGDRSQGSGVRSQYTGVRSQYAGVWSWRDELELESGGGDLL